MAERLAVDGGAPVRQTPIPYGQQSVDQADIEAVVEVLGSQWLTTGPKVPAFEDAFASCVGSKYAVAVSSGTAALHAAMFALGIGPGDEVIVPAMTFAATANCVVFQGGTPVFADVEPETLLLDPAQVEAKITSRTRAVIPVDYAGQPCDYDSLWEVTQRHGLALVDDACHALGGSYLGRPVGTLADLNTFSFHPVKHVAAGEGGMITTDDPEMDRAMRVFRNHGITTDHRQRSNTGDFYYEMVNLGYNYRISDLHCALGISQLGKLSQSVSRRQDIAADYDAAFSQLPVVYPLKVSPGVTHAYHLYVVQVDTEALGASRTEVFRALRAENIHVNVHYLPVHLHPYYQHRYGTGPGLCPVAEKAYERILSLPIFPAMAHQDVEDVIEAVRKVVIALQGRPASKTGAI